MQRICATPGCENPASLACPTCIKLGLPATYFCGQDCFRSSWKEHKLIHLPIPDEFQGYGFSGPLRPAPRSPYRSLPPTVPRPDYADTGIPSSERSRRQAIHVYSSAEILLVKEAGRIAREILDIATSSLHVGVTTDEIDRIVHEACIQYSVYPSPLNYRGFPKSVCTSINEVICHGIPDTRPIRDGDIINVDISIYHQSIHSDVSETWLVTATPEKHQESIDLMSIAYRALTNCYSLLHTGTQYKSIGDCIQGTIDSAGDGYSIVSTYCGHGVGFDFMLLQRCLIMGGIKRGERWKRVMFSQLNQ